MLSYRNMGGWGIRVCSNNETHDGPLMTYLMPRATSVCWENFKRYSNSNASKILESNIPQKLGIEG